MGQASLMWERIYEAVADRIKEKDRAFELADIRFGEARKWLVEHVNPYYPKRVLEIGYGQGYLTMELASALSSREVVGIDLLRGHSTIAVTRWYAKHFRMWRRISLIASDSPRLPFRGQSFDAVASFRALQDIKNTRGNKGVLDTVKEGCRTVKKNGVVAIADDSFPSCKPEGQQGRLFDAIKRYWGNLLPSTKEITDVMKKNGIPQVRVLPYDTRESLLPQDAETELRLNVECAKPFGVNVDFGSFWNEAGEIVKKEGRVFPQVILFFGIKA
jgi:ubiquinone/menaquinone biosynthesis C-methylase UbiE